MSSTTWRERRAACRRELRTCQTKGEMIDVLIKYSYANDPLHSGKALFGRTHKQQAHRRRVHRLWGVAEFYNRRNRTL